MRATTSARRRDLDLDIILILDAGILDAVVLGGGVRPGVGESDGESVEDERGDRRGGEMRQSRGWNVATDRYRRRRRVRRRSNEGE